MSADWEAYQGTFALWKDAGPDIPTLKEAKAEYASYGSWKKSCLVAYCSPIVDVNSDYTDNPVNECNGHVSTVTYDPPQSCLVGKWERQGMDILSHGPGIFRATTQVSHSAE